MANIAGAFRISVGSSVPTNKMDEMASMAIEMESSEISKCFFFVLSNPYINLCGILSHK